MNDQPAQGLAGPVSSSGEFRVGRVLSRSITMLSQNIPKLAGIVAIVIIPYSLARSTASAFLLIYMAEAMQNKVSLGVAVSIIFPLLFGAFDRVLEAVPMMGVFQAISGGRFRAGETFMRWFARSLPIFALAVGYELAVGCGFLLLLVPGCILTAALAVCLPACVLEGLSPLQSMKRSAELTEGQRGKLFGLLVLLSIANSLVQLIVQRIPITTLGTTMRLSLLLTMPALVWHALFIAFSSILITVLYHELRLLKEGPDTDRIAAVFD